MAPFTGEEDEKLISAVKERTILYNLQHKSYKDKIAKDNAWSAIASFVGQTVEECQTRWKTIRDSYFKNKKKKVTGSAAVASAKYDKMDLQFLDRPCNARKSLTNLQPDVYSDETEKSNKSIDPGNDVDSTNQNSSPSEPPLSEKQWAQELVETDQ